MSAIEPSVHALRSRAEALLPEYPAPQFGPGAAPEDISTLLRELRLHEIELELQNASLRETQVELEQSRTKLRELYEHAPIPYLRLGEDATILDLNDAALRMMHTTREDVIGSCFAKYVAADNVLRFARHRRAFAGSDTSVSCDLTLEIAGTPREVRLDSLRARDGSYELRTMITDLSDKHRLARTLEAHAFTSAILDAAGLIAVLDLRGRIIELNRACRALLDEPDAATGREFWEVFATPPEQRAEARQRLAAVNEAKAQAPAWEGTFSGSNGVQRHVAWSFTTLAEETAPIRYAIASGNDITALKALQAQLFVAERLAAIGQLAAGVGHEINNPLTYVKSSLEFATALFNGQPEERDKLKHMLDVAQEGVDRIRLIVDDLRVLSTHDVRLVEATDVRALLESCVQLATNEIRHRARLVVDYGDVPKVMSNAGRLSQVFLNLLVNAAQSIGQGHANSNEIRLCTRTGKDGGAIVEIRDSGAGIQPQDLAHIFEPFFTTKRMGEGTGLGLAICHGIIAELGGQISVESTPGHGTTFRVWLPAALNVSKPPAALAPAHPALTVAPRHILIIDDEPRITESFVLLLGKKHHLQTASNGRDALELCQSRAFDIIFCDLRMPEMGGNEIYQSLCEQNVAQAQRMVFMTGSLTSADELRAVAHDDIAILRKPFSVKELNAVLETCFSKN